MLHLYLGRAKSGKTAAIMDTIRRDVAARRGGSVLLVPEQYSHEAEVELLRACGDSLSLYGEVLSFSRLASRVESELGFGGRKTLSRGGRLLCLMLALDAVGSRLKLYGAARRMPPLQESLLAAIDECKQSRIAPEAVSDFAAAHAGSNLGDKLADLSLVYSAYDAVVSRSGLDPTDRLTLLAEKIGGSRFACCRFYIDGFTYFNAQECAVLEALLRAGAEVTVCLSCEGLEESYEIFEPSRRAALRLREIAEGCAVPCELTLFSEPGADTPMAFLEQKLFSFDAARWAGDDACISILRAGDVTAEAEAAAARCAQLVRTDGCRWRDIAIAARSFETYRDALENIFAHYDIPLYCAGRSDVLQKPLPALIDAAYAAVTGGWDYEDMIAYCKTGLSGLSRPECDTLENYAFLWEKRGNAWSRDEDWTDHPDGMAQEYTDDARARLNHINALRRRLVKPLHVLAQRAASETTAAGQARALADFFDALRLPEVLETRAEELKALGMVQSAAEYVQLWDITADTLEQCAAVLGETEMDAESFGKFFLLVLSTADVGSIPLSMDKVSAGDMDRMRRRHIRHLIVLGCDSTQMPRTEAAAGLFTDEDRETLSAAGLSIGDTAGERLDLEFALLYHCLTLPETSLTLSWSQSSGEGAAAMPSFVVNRAAALFDAPIVPVQLERCRTFAPKPAFELAAGARPGCAGVNAAALEYFRAAGRDAELQKLFDAAHLSRGRLSRSAVRALYGDTLRLSASRIDKLSGCSFAYFLQYGLKAKPRQQARFAPPELGTFMHYVLENVARDIGQQGGFAACTPETVNALCDKYVAAYVHERLNDFREKSPRFVYLFRRLTRDVRAVVNDMAAELANSDFVPLDFELNFGDREAFPPIALGEGEDSLTLIGVADRVDGWVHDGKLYLRVVDYKTGKKAFSLSDVWYGMGLQMLLYLFALQKCGDQRYGQEIVPAGVLYLPARDVLVRAKADMSAEEILAEKAKSRRRSGLLLDDPAVLQAMEHGEAPTYLPVKFKDGVPAGDALADLEQLGTLSRHIDTTLRELARELHAGSIAADPWFRTQTENACMFCDYAAACHRTDDEPVRYLTKLPPEAVWELMKKGGEQA